MPAHLQDGYQVLVNIALIPNISFWEKRVKPPGTDRGSIDEATQHSEFWRPKHPKALLTFTDLTMTGPYAPAVYNEIFNAGADIDVITVTFPDGSALAFYGWVDKFDPAELVEGEQPNATITIVPSMQDDTADFIEQDFVLT